VALAAAVSVQLGNCYRVEIDLSQLVDTSGNANDAGSGVGAHAGERNQGLGGNAGAVTVAAGGAGAGVEAGATSGAVEPSGAAGIAQGGVGGEAALGGAGGGGILINMGGACQDEPMSAEHAVCHLTGIKPGVKECAEADSGEHRWKGCYNGGCAVCTLHGELPDYPYYFDWHPCCSKNDTCSNHDPFVCNALCPLPTEHDKVAPCGKLDPNPG
jgi:hypothetical protein